MTAPVLEIYRTTETVQDASGASGGRGVLVVGDRAFYTLERLDGYKWLRPDVYSAEMGWWTSRSGHRARAIRILGAYSRGRIYLHPANRPRHLQGCIAVGMTQRSDGVGPSRTAFREIWEALGGFRAGAVVWVSVAGTGPRQ